MNEHVSQVFRIYPDSLQEKFAALRTKIQLYGGGFGNGKTAAGVVLKVLTVARDYPGANILVARETFPKLNDTIRKEFLKWCPPDWIKSFPMSANASNTCTLHNGTTINFRYIKQQGKNSEQGSSNLLSATYDLIVVDQMEDPGIEYKDFTDLLGRLRGKATYVGDDDTMPRTGPRWFVALVNPTRNWVYKRIVYPIHLYKKSLAQGHPQIHDDLLCTRDDLDEPVLDDNGEAQLIVGMVEGSTYENKENLEPDFIQTLEAAYRGQMRKRFLMGEWGAYEGLIYPQHDPTVHRIAQTTMLTYLEQMRADMYDVRWIGSYDYGMAVQSCLLLAFLSKFGDICIVDGFYEAGLSIEKQREMIEGLSRTLGIERRWNDTPDVRIEADPSIFRRGPGNARLVGRSIADLFMDKLDSGVMPVAMERGNNAVTNGITKMGTYLDVSPMHQNPFTGQFGAPHLFYSSHLEFITDEIDDYMWKAANVNSRDEREDVPKDGNDHAMDAIRYMVSRQPALSQPRKPQVPKPNPILQWREQDMSSGERRARHG